MQFVMTFEYYDDCNDGGGESQCGEQVLRRQELTEVRILLGLDSFMPVFLISLLIFHFVWILDIGHVFDCRNKNKRIW